MVSNKVKMLLQYRGMLQKDLSSIWKVSSKQAITNKMKNGRFYFSDIIKLCNHLGYDIVIKDRNTGNEIMSFDISDIKSE